MSIQPQSGGATQGMPFLGASSIQPSMANADDVETQRKHGHFSNLQVYAPANPRYRVMPANPALGFQYPMAIVEMAIHSPSSADRYQVTPIWVALPSNVAISSHRGTMVNNITATPLWNNLVNTTSMFNAAFISGHIGIAAVPGLSWNQQDDFGLPEENLIAAKKLDMSHVLVVGPEGFIPALTYDHTVSYNIEELDYSSVSTKYAQADTTGIVHPLRPHPVMSSITGYAAVKIDDIPEFYQDSNVQFGLISGNANDDRKRYSFVGHVFRDSRDTIGSHAIFEVQDNRRGADTSRAEAFLGSLQHGRYNEIEFHGSLRTFPIPKTNASVFRIQLTSWHIEGTNTRVQLESKQVTLANIDIVLNPVAVPAVGNISPQVGLNEPLDTVELPDDHHAGQSDDDADSLNSDIPFSMDGVIDSVQDKQDVSPGLHNDSGKLEDLPE